MFFPVMIDVEAIDILIIGGGKIAYRKISQLMEFGGRLDIIAPNFLQEIENMSDDENIRLIKRKFDIKDLDDRQLVIVATDDKELNSYVADECRKRGILVNSTGNHSESTLINTGFVKGKCDDTDAIISVSLMGKNPSRLKKAKSNISKYFDLIFKEQ